MTQPIIAIVGRTNVGKSTLLNRLAGRRIAVVADLPGTTRDRVFAFVSWRAHELTVIDTGGWPANPQSDLEHQIRRQVWTAIEQADIIVFMTDARDGVIGADEEIADLVRRAGKPTVLAANKVDTAWQQSHVADFYRLGVGTPLPVSAYHNRGIDDLMDAILAQLPPPTAAAPDSTRPRLAIVGRPNVGKSTLLNSLRGDERAIVHEAPGTTRDSLDAVLRKNDREFLLIDTAGIKRRGRVGSGVDYYSLLRSLQSINRCDVALLVIDAGEFVTAQDMHVAGYVTELGKGMLLIVNKWDLMPKEYRDSFKRSLQQRLRFVSYVPVLYTSARIAQGMDEILPEAWRVWEERQERFPRSEVDAAVKEAVSSHPPPRTGSRPLRVSGAYQEDARPASFVVQVNDPHLVHFSYERYLENQLRRRFGFRGVPLRVTFSSVRRGGRRKLKAVKT